MQLSFPLSSIKLVLLILLLCGLYAVNVYLRKVVTDQGEESVTFEGVTTEFLQLHWVDITALQLIGASIWSIVFAKLKKQPIHFFNRSTVISTAALCHLVATLAINASYSIVESDVSNLMLACQPFFTFFLMKTSMYSNLSSFISAMFVMVGAFMFRLNTTSLMFNSWGLIASIAICLALTKRNVVLKEGDSNWDNTLEKFLLTSSWSAMFVLPIWLLKITITGTIFTKYLLRGGGVWDMVVGGYSFTSFRILEMVSPVTHALVSVCSKLLSERESFLTFASISYSWSALFSLLMIVVGICLYVTSKQQIQAKWLLIKLLSLLAAVSCVLLLNPRYPLWWSEANQRVCKTEILSMSVLREKTEVNSISTAWLYDQDVPDSVITNIAELADHNPNRKLYVYCGTSQCVHGVASLQRSNVVAGFAVIPDIVEGMPLEKWAANHTVNKLIAGKEFERHLHEVTILGILWHYGGFFVSPMIRPINWTLPECGGHAVVGKNHQLTENLSSLFDIAYFTRNHRVIAKLAEDYASKYPKLADGINSKFDFANTTVKVDSIPELDYFSMHYEVESTSTSHYGILSSCAHPQAAYHLGDEMENFAGLQFLPFVDHIISRNNPQNSHEVTTFLNGRFKASMNDLALHHLNPIMLSVKLQSGIRQNWSNYLNQLEPIGSYDAGTLNYLHAKGRSVFMGSLMFLMKNVIPTHSDQIFIAGVPEEYIALLPSEIQRMAVSLVEKGKIQKTFQAVYQFLEILASAKLIITASLQYALSCVALNTPVIFINTQSNAVADTITSLFYTINVGTMTKDQVTKWFQNFHWHKIPQNPNPAVFMRLRATSWNVVRQNQHLYDTAKRFGVVPMSPPVVPPSQPRLVFYLIFTTSAKNSLSLHWSLNKMSGMFNWRHWRSVESIFYHHPTAEVKVYSNTLPENTFDVLTEVGYSIRIIRYNLEELLKGTVAEGFIKKLRKARSSPYWYSHQTDFLRMFILYRFGGIYMDTDIVIVKPVDSLKANSLGWQDSRKGLLNGAFLKFEKGNLFLEASLKEFVMNYRGDIWGYNCPELLTRVYEASQWSSHVVNAVDYRLFYMLSWKSMKKQCFTDTGGREFESHMETLKKEAYVIHTYSKFSGAIGTSGDQLKDGTLCKHILNSYCVLCDQIY